MEPDEVRRIITSIEQEAAAKRAAEQPQMMLEREWRRRVEEAARIEVLNAAQAPLILEPLNASGLILPIRTPWPLARDAAEASTEPPNPADQAESAD